MGSYYRRFVKDCASKVKPMTELTKKDKKFKWDDRYQQSFEELKRDQPRNHGVPNERWRRISTRCRCQ
ncbi:hypothetical protein DPMN_056867 [Dreissena polymorpha]|uniref:Uncharacterized protein n=1 Tax=Dreissena polymorpha TaxID=45954 RepID=A0A9D4HTL9_DREPO|nr:hypothetical protein DPMN_056867 [Dreissena polymorpha]